MRVGGGENRQQQTLALQSRMENGLGNSTSDYFESRVRAESNPHKAKMQELRELRWKREAAGGVGGGGGTESKENYSNSNSNSNRYNKQNNYGSRNHGGGRSSIDLSWN